MSFQNMGLKDEVVHAVQRLRYIDPSPIQAQAIPVIVEGKDIIASAQTGTGKTAAFALPLISRLHQRRESGGPRVLIVEPTRELAAQVQDALEDFCFFLKLQSCLLHGGVKYEPQIAALQKGPDFIIATPGRLLDHLESKNIDLSSIETVVLDEGDRMLDMGFLPDVSRIVKACTNRKQTCVFSATIPPQIQHIIEWALKDPVQIEINPQKQPAETVDHAFYPVASDQKFELLEAMLEKFQYDGIIIFSRTKMGADSIASTLEGSGHKVVAIHSDRSQSQRTKALDLFKTREAEVMVATDIAARGIDIAGVTHVINYDVPENPDDYIHRIGRTGRAAQTGDAITIITGFDEDAVKAIEHTLGKPVERRKLDDFNYKFTALLSDSPPTTRRRRRR
ncbi:MAG: DEAD/DEAH box helicase [Verrucomicrobiota bacterium]